MPATGCATRTLLKPFVRENPLDRRLLLTAAGWVLSCGTASAKDFYITGFEGDYDTTNAVSSASITDLGAGIKRADMISVYVDGVEMEAGVTVTTGSLDLTVVEVNCQSTPRQFREVSEYVQFSRTDKPIDKTSLNPYKNWTAITATSSMGSDADFICGWPTAGTDEGSGVIKLAADDEWEFVDRVVDTVTRIREK